MSNYFHKLATFFSHQYFGKFLMEIRILPQVVRPMSGITINFRVWVARSQKHYLFEFIFKCVSVSDWVKFSIKVLSNLLFGHYLEPYRSGHVKWVLGEILYPKNVFFYYFCCFSKQLLFAYDWMFVYHLANPFFMVHSKYLIKIYFIHCRS